MLANARSMVTDLVVAETDLPLGRVVAGATLAIIVGTEGPAYRPKGAGMVVLPDGRRFGHLSSGCIDADVALQALRDGNPRVLRYGRGSPFMDLALPCGGSLDILIAPRIPARHLRRAQADLAARRPATLRLGAFTLTVAPELRFTVFGIGPEAQTFAAVTRAAGYLVNLFSPDEDTSASRFDKWPQDVELDDRTAVTLFFHDHDREIPLLKHALKSPAFYVGAMGSKRAALTREAILKAQGFCVDRLRQPFGLIPSARNPGSLAVSVLADVLAQADLSFGDSIRS